MTIGFPTDDLGIRQGGGGDELVVLAGPPECDTGVAPDTRIELRWLVRNAGTLDWRGRSLRRIGAFGGNRLLTGRRLVAIPELAAGDELELCCPVRTPLHVGRVVGYWSVVDVRGTRCFDGGPDLSVVLAVR